MKLSFYIFIFFTCIAQAHDIGSDTSITRFNNQIVLGDGDRIAGGAAIDAGFSFLDAKSTASFDSIFPVQGEVALNGGSLYLNRDLLFNDISSLETLGTIIGNNYIVSLAPSMNQIPAIDTESNCNVSQTDTAVVAGGVTSCDWSFDNTYVAVLVSTPNSIEIYKVEDNELNNVNSTALAGTEVPTLLRWSPTGYFLAISRLTTGSAAIPELAIYQFNPQTNTLTLTSSFSPNVSLFGVTWHPTGNYLSVLADVGTATTAIFSVNPNGILNTAFLDLFSVASGTATTTTRHAFEFDPSGDYLVIGVNNTAGSPDIYILEFDITTETFSLNASLDVASETDCLAATFNPNMSNLIAASFDTPDNISILNHNAGAGTITSVSSNAQAQVVPTLAWSPNGSCLAAGRDTNFEVFSFNSSTFALSSTFLQAVATRVETVRWSQNGDNLFQSTFFTSTPTLYSGNAGIIIGNLADCVTFSNVHLFLNGNVTLQDYCITFSGNSVINGQGNCLSLSPTSSLIVDMNANLLIKNITIKGINNRRIVGTDSTSTFSFKNVSLVLDDNFTFDEGHFDIIGDVAISGDNYTFNYETDQVSTISSCARLTLNTGTTLRYNPASMATNLLQFTDSSAELFLYGATLAIVNEIELTKGSLFIDSCSFLSATGSPSEISLGDGISNTNNLSLRILPAGKLEISDGTLLHKNIE